MSSKRAQERALTLQDREVHRFYQPWLDAHGSSARVAAHVSDLAASTDFAREKLDEQGYTARSSRDKALTAFAQLAALRLGVRRAMVSLIDSKHQYVLAEATKTLSLVEDTRHAVDDALWLGSTVVARETALCQCAFTRTYTVADEKGNSVSGKGAVVPDCRVDPEFSTRPYVLADPGIRFYAGVPIKSRSGHFIGVYAVSCEKTRDPLTADEFRFMQDIASAIMDHLEWARDRVDRYKGERIVRGMAEFVEGSSTVRSAKEDFEEQVSLDSPNTENPPTFAAATDAGNDKDNAAASDDEPLMAKSKTTSTPKRSRLPTTSNEAEAERRPTTPVQHPPRPTKKSDGLSRVLDRAASILRQSTLAEGVVFFGPTGNTPSTNLASKHSNGMPDTDDEQSKRLSASQTEVTNDSTDSDNGFHLHLAKILGLSLTNSEQKSLFRNTAISVNMLETYFKLYPHGKSLHFTEQGSGLSSEDDSASESQRDRASGSDAANNAEGTTEKIIARRRKIRMSHQELLRNLPGVKNVIFIPLWDYIEEKIVAGCFIWASKTGTMMTQDDDLSYLRAFGNTILSEVIRLNAQKNDRAKTTFIASMSHELRSPLHGILGSVEFLQDTVTDSYQAGLITSISTCGKTLLDTLDHVLDYAKINKLGRLKSRKAGQANESKHATSDSAMESLNITSEVDLGLVVEEVVEAVCAGHAFKQMHTRDLESQRPAVKLLRSASTRVGPANGSNINNGEVVVLLDVSPRASWWVRTQPGALRRIIMNLLGNALKYTPSGFVAVSLRAQESDNPHKLDVIFRVVDSGKGMSEDFQKNRLFIPFSQEDSFQPGTGLGLSIVQQIVKSLGGTIKVKSVQDAGTEIDVHLKLPAAEVGIDVVGDLTSISAKTRGLRLCLLDPNGEKGRPENDHIARLDTTLREVAYGWFDMEVMKASSIRNTAADIFMYTEPPSVEYLLERHGVENKGDGSCDTSDSGREVPLIIVCLNTTEAIEVSSNHVKQLSALGRIIEVIPQPCGPRKLAKVLEICVRRMNETFGKSMQKEQDTRTARAPVEDQGSAMALGVASTTLPRLSSAEAISTRECLRELSGQTPPSVAVAFPTSKVPGEEKTNSMETLTYRNGPPKDRSGNDDVPHVLLVDDNRINLQLLVMFMKKHKFSYAEAQDGQQALDAYIASCSAQSPSSRRFDFVLMDISMPVMDGMESTRRIRAYEHENGLKRATIIALTGLASAQAQREAESSGIDVYMAKPVKFQELRPLLATRRGSTTSHETQKSAKEDKVASGGDESVTKDGVVTKDMALDEEDKGSKQDEPVKEEQVSRENKRSVEEDDKPVEEEQ